MPLLAPVTSATLDDALDMMNLLGQWTSIDAGTRQQTFGERVGIGAHQSRARRRVLELHGSTANRTDARQQASCLLMSLRAAIARRACRWRRSDPLVVVRSLEQTPRLSLGVHGVPATYIARRGVEMVTNSPRRNEQCAGQGLQSRSSFDSQHGVSPFKLIDQYVYIHTFHQKNALRVSLSITANTR